ncbi:HK97 gp10 family phage protein [Patescibacteria group bacterium]|nr:HK97 gp10 family phage protein [Patescibacteria group bacterium]
MPKLRVTGLNELNAKFSALSKAVDSDELQERIFQAAKIIGDEAIRRAPRGETGNLKSSIVAKKFKKVRPGQPAAFVGIDYSVGPHAHLVEFGHGGPQPAPAHPFFRPAWDSKKKEAEKIIVDGVAKQVESEARK